MVLDVPRSDVMIDALEPSSRIVIVANQELAAVRAATRLSAALRQRYGKDRLSVVVSRYDVQSEIGQDDVERVLGTPVAHTFPSNYRIALEALNAGRPVVLDNHNKLAAALTGFRAWPGGDERGTLAGQTASWTVWSFDRSTVVSVGTLSGVKTFGARSVSVMNSVVSITSPSADPRQKSYQDLKAKVHTDLLNRLNLERLTQMGQKEAEPEIRRIILEIIERSNETTPLSLTERETLVVDVLNELFGLGPLEALLRDQNISDILVNRFDQVYVERDGRLELTDILFRDDRHLMQIIERIVSTVGRRIDESSPMVDARLRDGSRVNAIIPPLAIDGPSLSIRRFRTGRVGAEDMVGRETMTQPMLDFLRAAVACRLNIIVSGGTGAGKTTLLNVLSGFISNLERVVTIEDAAELMMRQRHVVRLETRPPNIEGKGAVRQRDLVVNALRMRPDRIIVGEVRSDEALDMLQAMNTGHDGGLTTIHANSPRDALYRLDTMVAMANLNLPERAVRQQIASAVNLVIQVTRLSDGTRKVTAITEVTGMEGEMISTQDIFVFDRTGLRRDGKVCGRFRATGIRPRCTERLLSFGVQLPIDMFEHVTQVA